MKVLWPVEELDRMWECESMVPLGIDTIEHFGGSVLS